MAQSSRRTISILYILVGLFALAGGLFFAFFEYSPLSSAVIVDAEVTNVETRTPRANRSESEDDPPPPPPESTVTYEYQDETGTSHKGKFTREAETLANGDIIRISYSRRFPHLSKRQLDETPFWERMTVLAGTSLAALLLLGFGLFGLFRRAPAVAPVPAALSEHALAPAPGTALTGMPTEPPSVGITPAPATEPVPGAGPGPVSQA